MKRLPPEAFSFYVALGPERSYDAVARKYGVSKVTVVSRASKERWQERLREAEEEARKEANRKAVDTLHEVKTRQLQEARILEHRALEALRTLPPEKAVKAAVMLQIAWRQELLLLGEATERSELSVEEVTKREIETLLRRVEVDDGEDEPA